MWTRPELTGQIVHTSDKIRPTVGLFFQQQYNCHWKAFSIRNRKYFRNLYFTFLNVYICNSVRFTFCNISILIIVKSAQWYACKQISPQFIFDFDMPLIGSCLLCCSTHKGLLCHIWTTKALIRLRECAVWSEPSLSAYSIKEYCRI